MNEARRREIEAGTRCATCKHGNHVQYQGGMWVHLYDDGSFLGPCFDPLRAELLAEVTYLEGRLLDLQQLARHWMEEHDRLLGQWQRGELPPIHRPSGKDSSSGKRDRHTLLGGESLDRLPHSGR